MKQEVLRMENVYIGESPPYALENFQLNIYAGELVNLIGLSGAGKTALWHYFAGNQPYNQGRIQLGSKVFPAGKRMPASRDIVCIGQQSFLVPKLTVAENIFIIANRQRKRGIINLRSINYRARLLLGQYAPYLDKDMLVEELTDAQMHIVSLLCAIESEARLVVIDDVLSSYGAQEMTLFIKLLERLKEKKIAILYESHRPDFMRHHSDRTIIMRKGRKVRTFYREDYNEQQCYQWMIGNEIPAETARQSKVQQEIVLRMQSVSGGHFIRDVDLNIHKGEIVGVYDLENLANRELVQMMTGEVPLKSGRFLLNGHVYSPKNLDYAIRKNIGYIAGDISAESLVNSMSFMENLYLPVMKKTSKLKVLNDYSVLEFLSKEYMDEVGVREADKEKTVKYFDGYIQMSILFIRWILFRPAVMLCMEPWAKADIIMKDIINQSFDEMAANGAAILISSPDMNALKRVCDRIYRLDKGVFVLAD